MPDFKTRNNLPEDVEHALAADLHPREWSAPLKRAYMAEESGQNFQETRYLLLVILAACISTILIDLAINPAIVSHGLQLRLLFVAPIILIGLIISTKERSWVGTLAMCLSQLLFALIVSHLSFHMPVVSANRYLMSSVILLGLSNLMFRIRFAHLAWYNVAVITSQIALISLEAPGGWAGNLDYISIFLGVSFGTLALSERFTRLQSRNYLLRMRHQFVAEELQTANRLLQKLSDSDYLTSISNRRHFERLFQETYASDNADGCISRSVAVMMVDVDRFKAFNDDYGHQAGDRCLRAVASALDHLTELSGGIAARFGGEEFIIALPYTQASQATKFAEDIRKAIAQMPPVDCKKPGSTITASIGIALCSAQSKASLASLVGQADRALYAAKRCGRNQVVLAPERLLPDNFLDCSLDTAA